MQLRPIGGHIIVAPQVKEEKTATGIYLPSTADKDRPEQGTVIAVGAGKLLDNGTRQAIEVKEGDLVLFKSYSAHEVEVDKTKYLVVPAEEVMAIIV